MEFFGLNITRTNLKATPKIQRPIGDVAEVPIRDDSLFKAYIPGYLYRPPYGYPRRDNVPLIRNLAKNPYIYSVIKTLQDEAASTAYDIVYKKDVEPTPALDKIREEILDFFDNPNNNKESFADLRRKVVKDISEVDSGVWIKVFNRGGAMTQIFCHDGASFLKNPDVHGYIGNREDYVPAMQNEFQLKDAADIYTAPVNQEIIKLYDARYKSTAAYFQFGFTGNAMPVPFGKRELIYMMANPRSDSIYGLSPIAILADIIMSLVYGSMYNLDFYMNNNMPEGILSIVGADPAQVKRIREKLTSRVQTTENLFGKKRRVGFRIPVTNMPADYKHFSLDPKAMEIISQQQWFTKLVWACFGVTPDEMGFTEDSNRSTGQVQHKVYKRKAVRPMLGTIKYHIDKEIIPEWGEEAFKALEFQFDDYDLDEDLLKHDLYQKQVLLGIKTPEMIANELGIDYEEVRKTKETDAADQQDWYGEDDEPGEPGEKGEREEKPDPKIKSKKDPAANTLLEKHMKKGLKERGKKIIQALETLSKGSIGKV